MSDTHLGLTHWNNYIDGEWVDSDQMIEVENPATGEVVGTISEATPEQVDLAVAAARRSHAARSLTSITPYERMQMLHRVAAEIRALAEQGGELLCLEMANP